MGLGCLGGLEQLAAVFREKVSSIHPSYPPRNNAAKMTQIVLGPIEEMNNDERAMELW